MASLVHGTVVGDSNSAVITRGVVPPAFPYKAAVALIQAGGDDLVTQDEAVNWHVRKGRPFKIIMITGPKVVTTMQGITDQPVFSTKFILDCGATTHATGDESLFSCMFQVEQGDEIHVANGHVVAVHGIGTVVMEKFRVNGVLYAPGLTCSVISLSKLVELDYEMAFSRAGCVIKDLRTGEIVGNASLVEGLYHFDRLEIPLDRAPAVAP